MGQSRTRVNAIRTIALAGPAIDRIADAFAEDIASASPGMAITLHGQRFGSKVPKAWLEHVDAKTGAIRRLKLKTLRPLAHADAKGKPAASAMDPDSGTSAIDLVLPGAFPKDWDHAVSHDLVIDNGIGVATIPFATPP